MALKLKCPHPFQFPTGKMDILCLFVVVISNDDYFASHLITKIEDDHLFVRLYHSLCFQIDCVYVFSASYIVAIMKNQIMNDISRLFEPSVLGRHNYNISNTKTNFRLFHLMCLCSSGFNSSP